MRKYLLLMAMGSAMLVVAGAAFSQMAGGVGGGVGGSPQDARETDHAFDELRADKKVPTSTNAPDELVDGAALVKQQKYAEAVPHLELALAKTPRDVNVLIYLGFSHRMIGADLADGAKSDEFDKALDYYRRAHRIDPDNRLLHEFMGKLFLLMHDQASAESELKTLEDLCPSGCEERDTLSSVLLAYTLNRSLSPSSTPPAK